MNSPNACIRRRALPALLLCLLLCGCYPDLDWRPLAPTDAGFSILMPARSREEARPIADGATMHMWTTTAGDTVFGAGYADYADNGRLHFDAVRNAFLGKTGNKLIEDREYVVRSMAVRALTIDAATDGQADNARIVQVRLYSSGRRLYQVAIIGRAGSISPDDAELYFDSFRIQN